MLCSHSSVMYAVIGQSDEIQRGDKAAVRLDMAIAIAMIPNQIFGNSSGLERMRTDVRSPQRFEILDLEAVNRAC